MYIKIVGNDFSQNIFKEIEAITDNATLYFRNSKYDEKEKTLSLPIERYRIKKKEKLLGSLTPYKRDMNNPISSSVVIRNITSYEMRDNSEPEDTKVTLIFGVTIKDKEISIRSAEEDRGKTCYFIGLTVSEYDIEIMDKKE